jgi:hypothetical protein
MAGSLALVFVQIHLLDQEPHRSCPEGTIAPALGRFSWIEVAFEIFALAVDPMPYQSLCDRIQMRKPR